MKRFGPEFFVMVALYLLSGKMGLLFSISETATVTPVWPPSGFSFIFLSLFGLQLAPAVLVGAVIVNILNFISHGAAINLTLFASSFVIGIGSTLQAYYGIKLYNEFIGHDGLLKDVNKTLKFSMAIVPLTCLIGATFGVFTLLFYEAIHLDQLFKVWFTWWLGDMSGIIVLFPMYVTWIMGQKHIVPVSIKSCTLAVLGGTLLTGLIFSPLMEIFEGHHIPIFLTFLLFPVLSSISYAFRHYAGSSLTLIATVIAIIGATAHKGPFEILNVDDSFIYLTLFIWSMALTSMVLATLANEREQLVRIDHAKTVFLSTISHEIRTPLNIIIGLSNILKAEKLDTRTGEYVHKIASSSDLLLSLLNNVMDVSKIDSEKMSIHKRIFKTTSFFKKTKESFDSLCMEQGITYTQKIDLNISKYLIGDEYRLMQVFNNLIGNALKFTEKGKVELCVYLHEITADHERVKIVVKDSGIGIDKNRLDTIFQKFTQADSSITRKYGGTGLGLYLSNQLVKLMGGKLKVKSEKDEGTEFSFFLDFEVPSVEQVKKLEQQSKLPNFSHMTFDKVLLVDDSVDNLDLLKVYLKDNVKEIVTAVNGQEAIDKFKQGKFDFVILDIEMPIKDGVTALKEMQQFCVEKLLSRPLMVALTAYSLRSELERYKREGFDIVMTKPIRKKDLFLTLFQYESTKKAS